MDKKQLLIIAYQGLKSLEADRKKYNEARATVEELEKDYIHSVVVPELETKMNDLLSGLPKTYDLFGRFEDDKSFYIEVQEASYPIEEDEEIPPAQPVKCCGKNSINNFVLAVIEYFDRTQGLQKLESYLVPKANLPLCSLIKKGIPPLHGIFLESSYDEMTRRNTPMVRWYDQTFMIGSHRVFLSTQWRDNHKDSGLQLSAFQQLIQAVFGKEYRFERVGKEYCMFIFNS